MTLLTLLPSSTITLLSHALRTDILGAIMKAILGGKMLSTKHSRQMHEIFNTHLDTIDTSIK